MDEGREGPSPASEGKPEGFNRAPVVLSVNYETNRKEVRMELRRQTFVRVNNAQALGLSLVSHTPF